MRIPAAGQDRKCAVFGAVDYATGQVIFQRSARKRSARKRSARKGEDAFAAFLDFLDHLAQTLPAEEPVVVVLDNVGSHKSHTLRAQGWRFRDRLHPFFLPAYSPELNLIERRWRYLKAQLACHRWWNDLARLQQATETLLANLEVHFHAADEPAFRLVQNFRDSA
jgi:hypothetical protein